MQPDGKHKVYICMRGYRLRLSTVREKAFSSNFYLSLITIKDTVSIKLCHLFDDGTDVNVCLCICVCAHGRLV